MHSANTHLQAPYNGAATGLAFGGSGGNTYSWIYIGDCAGDSITGDSTFITSLLAGLYALTVTDINGCTAIDTVSVSGIGCPTISIQDDLEGFPTFDLYPNPTHEAFILQIVPTDRTQLQVGLFDLDGQAIEVRILRDQRHYAKVFHLSQLSRGVYILQVTNKMSVHSHQLMVYWREKDKNL